MTDLRDKTVLLTGASTGIGACCARALAREGCYLVAQYYGNTTEGAEQATAGLPNDRKLLVHADFSKPEAADQLWDEARAWRGRIDVLVNNAAILLFEGGIDAPDEDWDRVWSETMQVNVLAPARLLRNAVRHFRENGGGVAVTMGSWVGQRGSSVPDLMAYAASKAAIRAATQTVARKFARENVLAYIISPGVVRTEMSERSAERLGGEEAVTSSLAMGEWVPPGDLAELLVFLASGKCRHLTGATLEVNGATWVR
jgi:NAD(P)-dependent dehydrogenase (short-subunit alcohol dehydrogenase family)